jgi:plastocyanin
MNKLAHGGLAALLAMAVGASVAYADATIYAAPPNQFFQGDVTIAQGDAITFTNFDTVPHDVTATAKGGDGKPVFQSAQVGAGQSAPVAGVEYLTSGSYPYICSIHPFMKGTITVSSAGAPKPRPGAGSSPPSGSPAAADTTAPSLTVKLLDTKRSQVRKRRSLQISVTMNEPATVAITARSGTTVVAKGSAKLTKAATRKLSVKLTRAGINATKRSNHLAITVAVDAKDSAGNAAHTQASGKLR